MNPCGIIGMLSDVQCAYAENAWNYTKTSVRHYRRAFDQLDYALECMIEKENVTTILQLGDLLDGKCTHDQSTEKVLKLLETKFNSYRDKCSIFNVIGNHDLYNLTRAEMLDAKNRIYINDNVENLMKQSKAWDLPHKPVYYSLNHIPYWKIIILDSYDFSILGLSTSDAKYQEAFEYLCKHNPHEDKNESPNEMTPWLVAFNGAIDSQQLIWLKKELDEARQMELNVLVACHVPFHPKVVANLLNCVLWNYKDVLNLLKEYMDCIRVCATGHTHDAAVHMEKDKHSQNTLFISLPGIVEMKDDVGTARPHCTLTLYKNSLSLKGSVGIEDINMKWQ